MSSVGWAAAIGGLGHGFQYAEAQKQKALEQAAKQRLLDLQGQEIGLKNEAAKAEKIKTKVALEGVGYDEQGSPLPGYANPGESQWDATARRKRAADYVHIPGLIKPSEADVSSQRGMGPTAPGAATGFGSLVPKMPQGLDLLSGIAGQDVDPKLLTAYVDLNKPKSDPFQMLMMRDLLSGQRQEKQQEQINTRQDKQIENQNQRFDQGEQQTQNQQLYKALKDAQVSDIARAADQLDSLTGIFSKGSVDKKTLDLFPGTLAYNMEDTFGNKGAALVNKFRSPQEQQVAAALQAFLNPQIRAAAGLNQTAGEVVRQAVEKARNGDPSVLVNILRSDNELLKNKVNEIKGLYPKAQISPGSDLAGDVYFRNIENRKNPQSAPKPNSIQASTSKISPSAGAPKAGQTKIVSGKGPQIDGKYQFDGKQWHPVD